MDGHLTTRASLTEPPNGAALCGTRGPPCRAPPRAWLLDTRNTVGHPRRCSTQPKGLVQSSLGQRPRNTWATIGAFALKARNSNVHAGQGAGVRLQRERIRSCVSVPGALPQAKLFEPFGLVDPQTTTVLRVSKSPARCGAEPGQDGNAPAFTPGYTCREPR